MSEPRQAAAMLHPVAQSRGCVPQTEMTFLRTISSLGLQGCPELPQVSGMFVVPSPRPGVALLACGSHMVFSLERESGLWQVKETSTACCGSTFPRARAWQEPRQADCDSVAAKLSTTETLWLSGTHPATAAALRGVALGVLIHRVTSVCAAPLLAPIDPMTETSIPSMQAKLYPYSIGTLRR